MKIQTAKEELMRVARLYPTLLGTMQREIVMDGGTKTVGTLWAEEWSRLDAAHLGNVLDTYAEMRRPLPEPTDRFAQVVIEEVRELMAKDQEALEQHEKHLGRQKARYSSDWPNDHPPWLDLRVCRYKMNHPNLEAERAAQLDGWVAGGEKPDWLTREDEQFLLGDNRPRIVERRL